MRSVHLVTSCSNGNGCAVISSSPSVSWDDPLLTTFPTSCCGKLPLGIGAHACRFVFVHPLEHAQTKSSSLGVHSSPLEIISACVKMLGINLGTWFREQQRQTGQRT